MSIVVIDYGMGNLRSVSKAIEHLGGQVQVSSGPSALTKADKLVLPGVGAFGDAMNELNERALIDPILKHIQGKKPFLGICLGLQILFESSEESPLVQGLAIFKGKVRAFDSKAAKVPHMGWNQIAIQSEHPILKGVGTQKYFYFVHSYFADPVKKDLALGTCGYGGQSFAAIVGNGTTVATQFHPEKSQESGLQILKNFIAW